MRLPKRENLTRREAKERGISRKEWKRSFKKIGKLKYKSLHTKATQTTPEQAK